MLQSGNQRLHIYKITIYISVSLKIISYSAVFPRAKSVKSFILPLCFSQYFQHSAEFFPLPKWFMRKLIKYNFGKVIQRFALVIFRHKLGI